MNQFRSAVTALTFSLIPTLASAQCEDGVCRLPSPPIPTTTDTPADARRLPWTTRNADTGLVPSRNSQYSRNLWDFRNSGYASERPLPSATYEPGREGDHLDCRNGTCRLRPEQPYEAYRQGAPYGGRPSDLLTRETTGGRRPAGPGDTRRTLRPGDLSLVAPRPLEDPFRRPDVITVPWMQNYEHAIAESRRTGRPLLIRVSASWCQYCERMKRETYADSAVVRDIRGSYIPVALDGDRDRRLIEALGVRTLPTTLIVAPDLRIVDRVEGFRTARQMTQMLGRFARRAMRETGYHLAAR